LSAELRVPDAPRVLVLADDLIWSTRLVDGVRRAGGAPVAVRTGPAFVELLGAAQGALVDLTARAYDGLEAIAAAEAAGVPVVGVGQHDDVEVRRAAKAAGARRVHAYRALFEHGDRELGTWLASLAPHREVDA
jgi:hypothetical protein